MAWEIEFTAQAERWLLHFAQDDFEKIAAAIDRLEEHGPALGRPTVDTIKRHATPT